MKNSMSTGDYKISKCKNKIKAEFQHFQLKNTDKHNA